ncbi:MULTISPECIES: Z-ring formation inhibitor MciZ [unclassified Bacillus (in: firmicutes)]|uniref:Z-ring formation inhibitor MciZ n=1 Tax=unclassified Bacillus (in: firmicutes) TaxID=185979 RepID=UPI0008E93E91|nr:MULTISPECIES: Z-ring formation inhibitor MciZ [unclassified Bacillus (in: firmicutes)]SFA97632.1 Protein of unknown function [Bacillus sp. UNCCL13]SFQ80572.1 Protein of unknown function [Bacillus sp. cl95]
MRMYGGHKRIVLIGKGQAILDKLNELNRTYPTVSEMILAFGQTECRFLSFEIKESLCENREKRNL